MRNTLEVIRFEIMRSVKKPSFWLAAILAPVMLGLYVAIAALSGYSAGEMIESGTDTSKMSLGIYDGAKYLKTTTVINPDESKQELVVYESEQAGIDDVQNKKLDVFYVIPEDFAKEPTVKIYVKPEVAKIMDNYSMPIMSLLQTHALSEVSAINYAIITNSVTYDTTTYSNEDNHVIDESELIGKMAGPIIALVLFYILIVVLGNRLVAAMTEEKENRISELMLTSISPHELIIGKIISLMILGIIQLIVLVIPALIIYKIGLNYNVIPNFISSALDAISILQYILLLIASYFLYTAGCVVIGTLSPTAKDANSFSGVFVIMVILPIFFIGSLASSSPDFMAYFLSYFPPSAPIAVMLRAIFGNLAEWEYWVALADIVVSGALLAKLATYIFCKNAIEFTAKINLRKLLGKPRKTWKN